MRKLLLCSIILVQSYFFAQLPDGTFENWTTNNYENPTGWLTANLRDFQRHSVFTVTKVTGFSGYAMRIETKVINGDTTESYIVNSTGTCDDPQNWTGGVPYSQQPTALTGKYRYNLPGNDTAIILVIFRKNNANIGNNLIKIRGTGNQSTFASFSYPVTCSGAPDSVIIAAAASNKISNAGIQHGSFIELDNLAFTGATQVIPNGNFENWTALNVQTPSGWDTWSFDMNHQTASAHSGNFAMNLATGMDECGEASPATMTSGTMGDYSGPEGGQPYNLMTDTLCGYYKYLPAGSDLASVNVTLTYLGMNAGGNGMQLSAASVYSYFEVPFSAFTTPDTIRIDFQSSQWPVTLANVGSTLYLDDLYLKSNPLGIFSAGKKDIEVKLFPNPVSADLRIKLSSDFAGEENTITIYNALNQEQGTYEFTGNNFNLNTSHLSSGIYYLQLKNKTGVTLQKFVKQ